MPSVLTVVGVVEQEIDKNVDVPCNWSAFLFPIPTVCREGQVCIETHSRGQALTDRFHEIPKIGLFTWARGIGFDSCVHYLNVAAKIKRLSTFS